MKKLITSTKSLLTILFASALFFSLSASTHAASTITVNTNTDTTADDGLCTLREAITTANTDTASGATSGECIAGSGSDTIEFNITGTADFTNNSQNGYTIQPTSQLPDITETVTIDGYSQPGSQANTAVAPNPLNGILLVELDGSSLGDVTGLAFAGGSANSIVKGLVINSWGSSAVIFNSPNDIIQGSYVGTDYTGSVAKPNAAVNGFSAAVTTSNGTNIGTDLLIGGLDPSERNLISGNRAGGIGQGADNWTYYGNYVGVAADGLTALENSSNPADLSGGATIDDASGAIIGGTQQGAANVWSGNDNSGVSPQNFSNIVVKGNYFGVGFDGITPVANGGGFICESCSNVTIGDGTTAGRNIFSGNNEDNTSAGLSFGASSDITIKGNYLGVDKSGVNPAPNGVGLSINDTSNVVVGSSNSGDRNIISANYWANVVFWIDSGVTGATNTTVQGNYIGVDKTGSINQNFNNGIGMLIFGPSNNNIIGGVNSGERNIIADNKGGVLLTGYTLTPFSVTVSPAKNAIVGNSIYKNNGTPDLPDASSGIGIDMLESTQNSLPPNYTTLDSTMNTGPTLNDITDSDTGANNYINSPALNKVTQDGTQATVNFNLDAADSPTDQYRVEFFANDTPDPSGYGEGQTFLGSATVTNGDNQQTSFTLPTGTNLTGKSISATTTALDSTTTSGFGSTSEFSRILLAEVTNTANSQGSLASTGSGTLQYILIATATLASSMYIGTKVLRNRTV